MHDVLQTYVYSVLIQWNICHAYKCSYLLRLHLLAVPRRCLQFSTLNNNMCSLTCWRGAYFRTGLEYTRTHTLVEVNKKYIEVNRLACGFMEVSKSVGPQQSLELPPDPRLRVEDLPKKVCFEFKKSSRKLMGILNSYTLSP